MKTRVTRSGIKKVVCFGDSLTEGWIDAGAAFHPYTMKLSELLNDGSNSYKVINEGLSGETVFNEMRERLPLVLTKYKPIDIVILQGGTNDILQHADKSINFIEQFKKLVNIIKEHEVKKICVMTIMEGYFTPDDGSVSSHAESDTLRRLYNEQIIEFANQEKLILCDIAKHLPMFNLMELERKNLWDDMLHPSISGYDKMGKIVFNHIRNEV